MSSHSQQRVEGPLSPPTRGHIGEIHSTTEELIEVMSQIASTLLYVSSKLLSNQTTSPLAGFIVTTGISVSKMASLNPGRRFSKSPRLRFSIGQTQWMQLRQSMPGVS